MNDEVKPKLELIELFSTPVVRTNINREFTEDELQLFNTDIPMFRNEDSSFDQSESFNIFDNFAIELKNIKTFCEHELKRYLENIEGVNTDITNLNITASWLNKMQPQASRGMHTHKNSYLSGTLYIRCLPNDNILLSRAHQMYDTVLDLPKEKLTKFAAKVAMIPIKEGDFIIFPSHIPHLVAINETKNKERISLSFHTWPTYLPSLYPPYK